MSVTKSAARRRAVQVAKWALCLIVLLFVARRGWELWQSGDLAQFQLRPGWLLLSGLVYALGWVPSVWFWFHLMRVHGQRPPGLLTVRAYYCGHLGKYIPGKATVLLIRGGMLRAAGVRFSTAAVTAAYETLASMGTGLALGLALLPWLIRPEQLPSSLEWLSLCWQRPWLVPVAMVVLALLATPAVASVLNRIAGKMSRDVATDDTPERIETLFVLQGIAVFCLSWCVMGLSLGLCMQSVAETPWTWQQWPRWTGAVSLATSLGFVALFAPGGVGIREGILMEVLSHTPDFGPQAAVAVAVMLRLVWLVTELLVAALLCLLIRRPPPVGETYADRRAKAARADPTDGESRRRDH